MSKATTVHRAAGVEIVVSRDDTHAIWRECQILLEQVSHCREFVFESEVGEVTCDRDMIYLKASDFAGNSLYSPLFMGGPTSVFQIDVARCSLPDESLPRDRFVASDVEI